MTTLLDPNVLARIRTLDLAAKQIVEGVLAGAHKGPRHGFAVEFAQHREYVPGDDVKHLDWKVFGRTERYFLKQYDLETDMTAWLVVDASGSMRYASAGTSKYDYACLLAASLAHLVLRQADRIGLAVVDAKVRQYLRAEGQSGFIAEIIRHLAAGPGAEESRLGAALHELAGRVGRRSVIMIFSDYLDEPAEMLEGIRRLRFDRHEVIAFRVIDPAEVDFPFSAATMFRGLELPQQMLTDPRGLRRAYCEEFAQHQRQLAAGVHRLGAELIEVRTDDDAARVLAKFLRERG